jgi:hypothetical protein
LTPAFAEDERCHCAFIARAVPIPDQFSFYVWHLDNVWEHREQELPRSERKLLYRGRKFREQLTDCSWHD